MVFRVMSGRAQGLDNMGRRRKVRVAYAEIAGLPLEQVDAAFVYVRDGAVVRPEVLHTRAELEALLLAD